MLCACLALILMQLPDFMTIHASLNLETILGAISQDENTGFCVACGASRGNCEPDTKQYRCDACGEFQVYGAEQILIEFQPE